MSMPAAPQTDWTLAALLQEFTAARLPQLRITGVADDSRNVTAGDLFLACPGESVHGLEFVAQAVRQGAVAIAWDAGSPPHVGVPAVQVSGLRTQAGAIAATFWGKPSQALYTTAITGTDGKTSCAHMLAQAEARLGHRCGYIGTLGCGFPERLADTACTTPGALNLQQWFARLVAAGADSVALEASSHALVQDRLAGTAIDVAVLTNIGRDHLDYHGSQQAYIAAKHRLFEQPGLKVAVLNADDPVGAQWLDQFDGAPATVAYGLDAQVASSASRHVRAVRVDERSNGLMLDVDGSWGRLQIATRLIGRFNAYNLLAVLVVLLVRGHAPAAAAGALADVHTVPGRMQAIDHAVNQPLVVVDFAHTPGALEAALQALRAHVLGQLLCVFGCGGERDRGKRPLMGAVAARHADAIWITDDNPRTEDAAVIVADILQGMPDASRVVVEHDRGRAITAAIAAAGAGDAVLVAGKGHETHQQIGNQRRAFDDREVVARVLEAAA